MWRGKKTLLLSTREKTSKAPKWVCGGPGGKGGGKREEMPARLFSGGPILLPGGPGARGRSSLANSGHQNLAANFSPGREKTKAPETRGQFAYYKKRKVVNSTLRARKRRGDGKPRKKRKFNRMTETHGSFPGGGGGDLG